LSLPAQRARGVSVGHTAWCCQPIVRNAAQST
jgi:hypothetical protein